MSEAFLYEWEIENLYASAASNITHHRRKKQKPAFLHILFFRHYLATLSIFRLPTRWFYWSFFPFNRRNSSKITSDIPDIAYIVMKSNT